MSDFVWMGDRLTIKLKPKTRAAKRLIKQRVRENDLTHLVWSPFSGKYFSFQDEGTARFFATELVLHGMDVESSDALDELLKKEVRFP